VTQVISVERRPYPDSFQPGPQTLLPRSAARVCAAGQARVGQRSADETEDCTMSGTDKMKDKAQELAGRGKEAVGDATDNRDLQAEGQKDQAAGNLKQAGEKVKDAFK
jgi:uncharacterized protein YjbJ (UPF0337 family)